MSWAESGGHSGPFYSLALARAIDRVMPVCTDPPQPLAVFVGSTFICPVMTREEGRREVFDMQDGIMHQRWFVFFNGRDKQT